MNFNTTATIKEMRQIEASRLTGLLERNEGFSYVRLGDGELAWMLLAQDKKLSRWEKLSYKSELQKKEAYCVAGLQENKYYRLIEAFNNCSYLDRYDFQPYCYANLGKLKDLSRSITAEGNPVPEVSMIFYDWVRYEMKNYVSKHKCLFVGAEAPLVKELMKISSYREKAQVIIPEKAEILFQSVRDGGRNIADKLDLILQDIESQAKNTSAHTVFLSLGTAAKIICTELANKTGIRMFDFGSMLRAMTYSGSPGYQSHPSSHCPFIFRVSLHDFMTAWEKTNPNSDPINKVCKMHSQLRFDLLRKTPFSSVDNTQLNSENALDLSKENINYFYSNYYEYKKRLKCLIDEDVSVLTCHHEFKQLIDFLGVSKYGKFKKLIKKLINKPGSA